MRVASAQATSAVGSPVMNMYAAAGVIVGSTVRVVAQTAQELAEDGWTLERFAEALLEVQDEADAEDELDPEVEAARQEDMEREMDRLVALPDQVELRERLGIEE